MYTICYKILELALMEKLKSEDLKILILLELLK